MSIKPSRKKIIGIALISLLTTLCNSMFVKSIHDNGLRMLTTCIRGNTF